MKRRRRKKRRFHTGVHTSPKLTGECKYRSGWELAYAVYLDADPAVTSYAYESLKIPYVSNVRSGRLRHYFPDFVVTRSGTSTIVEIKSSRFMNRAATLKKAAAGRAFALAHEMTYELLTEKELKGLGVL